MFNEDYTLVLDMDGTLLDLNFDDQVWNFALPAALATRDARTLSEAREHVALTLDAVRGTLPWYCHDHWERQFGISVHELEVQLAHFIGIRAGTVEFLHFLQRHAYRTILATNAHPASLARKMERTGLAGYFTTLVSAHTLGVPKEAPEFWHALETQIQFNPARAVLVDDNLAVLSTARASGLRHVFGVRSPSSTGLAKEFPCFASVDSLTELIPWLVRAREREFMHRAVIG